MAALTNKKSTIMTKSVVGLTLLAMSSTAFAGGGPVGTDYGLLALGLIFAGIAIKFMKRKSVDE